MGINPMQQCKLAGSPLCVVLQGCHVYAPRAVTADAAGLEGGWLMAMPLLCWQCKHAGKLGIQLMPRRVGSGCCTKPSIRACVGNRWPQAGANGPQQKGARIHCIAGSLWCPAQLALAPVTDRCPGLSGLGRRRATTDALQGVPQAALRALQFLITLQVPARQAAMTVCTICTTGQLWWPTHLISACLAAGACGEACRAGSSCHRWASSSCSPSCVPA